MNLDFRVAGDANPSASGSHRIWLGEFPTTKLAEVIVSANEVLLRSESHAITLGIVRRGEWQNLQLVFDLKDGTVQVVSLLHRMMLSLWQARISLCSHSS